MSELIERFSPYTIRLPSESFERLPSEAERKLWLVPEAAEIEEAQIPEAVEAEETQIEAPDLAASWRQVRRNFGEMRQSVKIAKTELQAVGRLAMLDVAGAQTSLQGLDVSSPEDQVKKRRSLKERIIEYADDVAFEKRRRRQEKFGNLRHNTKSCAISIGFAALCGIAVAERSVIKHALFH